MSFTRVEHNRIYGLDGDKVGGIIDAYFIKNDINALEIFSARVAAAMEEIRKTVIDDSGTVVFCAGDSILFHGIFGDSWCDHILTLFLTKTGCTASMGIGRTATEAYLGLKLAKASGGGKVIHYSLLKELENE